jgi:hypothetical protein
MGIVFSYFNNPTGGSNPVRTSLGKTFDKYRDDPKNTPDEIGVEGTGTLLEELNIDLSDVGALVFSELVRTTTRPGGLVGSLLWLDLTFPGNDDRMVLD